VLVMRTPWLGVVQKISPLVLPLVSLLVCPPMISELVWPPVWSLLHQRCNFERHSTVLVMRTPWLGVVQKISPLVLPLVSLLVCPPMISELVWPPVWSLLHQRCNFERHSTVLVMRTTWLGVVQTIANGEYHSSSSVLGVLSPGLGV
jgi:hypothetical protein